MRLNRLRIAGFKSFPERADLAFDTGVTAIVGPNGCGKSNVIDAITWVLGEQSARSLRGERMEDVIFGGSDARRPTATAEVRLQLSQVTAALALLGGRNGRSGPAPGHGSNGGEDGGAVAVALADEPGDELDETPCIARDVEVGRRLFRSGESEYLIDGQVCRLRDIQDLLMDSGVGVKAYAVIEQGAIGQILSARPLERRRLLEEAAGVTRYKSRRRAAELKLEAAQQNLTRVDDIVFEVDKQRGALKRQAAKARRYGRLREELRRWEKVSYARKGAALAQAGESAAGRLDDARTRETGAAARLAALEAAHEQQRLELAAADRSATAARDAAHAHELAAGRLQQQIEFETQQVASVTEAAARGAAELAALEAKRQPLQAELSAQADAWQRCDAERQAAGGSLESAAAALAAAQAALEGLEADVETSRNEVFATMNAATVLQHVLKSVPETIGRVDGDIAKLEAEAADVATESARLTADREAAAALAARVEAALAATRATRAERAAEHAAARQARESRIAAAREREHELTSLSARVASLEELVAGREGYNDAARLLLSQPPEAFGHLGSVADHLHVDREHERALEAGLGELLQCVVVRGREDARKGMELAAANGAGRCGFFLAREHDAEEPAPRPASGLTPLADLARVDGPAAAAVRRLLARRWLAPSFEAAAAAARETRETIVTPAGVVFRGSTVVHGGGRSATRGILRTEGELEELRGRRETEQEAVRRLGAEVAELDAAVAAAEAELERLQADEHAREKELLEARLGLSRCDEEAARLQQRHDVVRTECGQAREEREALTTKQAEARDEVARLEVDQRAAEERSSAAQRRLLDARESVEGLGREANQARVAHAERVERAAGLEAHVSRLREAAADLERRASAGAADNERAAAELDALRASIARTEVQLDAETGQLEMRREEVRAVDASTADLRERIDAQGREVQAAREALDAVHAEVAGIEVERARAEAELATLSAACRDSLQTDLEQVRAEVEQWERDGVIAAAVERPALLDDQGDQGDEVDEGETPAAAAGAGDSPAPALLTAEDVIGELRAKIDRLGPVNLMAIDQFDELEQRHDFLTAQRKDLLDSIESTGAAIERIDATTRERFREAFTAVNEHLQTTFSTLFGGGRAGLALLDEDDVLESGIDIVAQPPGKRLQSIQLLSGGEKALTAMALMFAIFKYKPSPFCLLDEIDAPLDEANVGRFVDMLRGMEDCTQFVVVTHNRKTMEIADRLYGVTMEEPGVSKLISVRLN